MAASASAANEKYDYNYERGYACWDFTDGYICMYVNDYDEYTFIDVYGWGLNYSFSGYAAINKSETGTDVFTISKKNDPSASLSEVTFNVTDYLTYEYESKPVTINVDWVCDEYSATRKDMDMVKEDNGNIYKDKSKELFSEAIATGSICLDGVELIGEEPSDEAVFYSINDVEMVILKK